MTQLLQSTTVTVLEGRVRFHVPTCRTVLGRSSSTVLLHDALEAGMTPCGVCKPDAVAPQALVRRLRAARRERAADVAGAAPVRRALPLGHVTVPAQASAPAVESAPVRSWFRRG